LQIGSKQGQRVFQSKVGADLFLQLDENDLTLRQYVVVETLLQPRADTVLSYMEKPFYWADTTGMMYVLEERGCESYAQVKTQDDALDILEDLKVNIEDV
jgi:hypothetical protein